MITVACISCSHQYPLDERRLPATGLKMRCPKCGTTFLVFPDGRTEAAPVPKTTMLGGMGAAPSAPKVPPPPPPKPMVPAPPPPSDDLDELDLPAPRGAKAPETDDVDLPAPRGAAPKPPPRAPIAPPFGGDDLDLPAPRGAMPKPSAPALDDLDLPALRGAGPKTGPPVPGSPAARKAPIAPPMPPPAMTAPPLDDLDLPAPRGAKAPIAPPMDTDLPALRGGKAPIAPPMDTDLPALRGGKAPIAPPIELDLPALRGARAPAAAPLDELDLPAPRGAAKRAPAHDELDLPALRGGGASMLEIDLPAPRGHQRVDSVKPALADMSRTPFDDPDAFDLPQPSGRAGGIELDLPAPKGGLTDLPAPKGAGGRVLADADRAFGDLDLPMPKRAGVELTDLPAPRDAIDLPAPRGSADLPALRDGTDLPAPRGSADLPVLRGPADLPAPRGPADLPQVRRGPAELPPLHADGGGAFPDLDLPPPRRGAAPAAAPMGDLDLPPPRARTGGGPSVDQDLELPPPRKAASARASVSEFELPVPDQRPDQRSDQRPDQRRSVPPRGHGEIDLPEGGDMEFADIPEERAGGRSPSRVDVERPAQTQPKTLARSADKPRSRRGIVVAVVLIALIAGVGGALYFTPYGPFGIHAIEQLLPEAASTPAVQSAMAQSSELVRHDTPASYRQALRLLGTARHDAGLNRPLLSRSLYVLALAQLRFGDSALASSTRGIRERIHQQDPMDPVFALGLAAEALQSGDRSHAASLVSHARAFAPDDPLVDLLDGEIALANESPADASQAFQAAIDHDGGAAARWGFARALSHGDDLAAYDAALAATLEAAPDHVEALYARALRLHATGDDAQAITLASQVVGREPLGDQTLVAHARLRAEAWSLLGSIYESRGRTGQALEAYQEAADADSSDMAAILGEGRMLLLDRPADALARFEAVIGAAEATTLTLPDGRTANFAARLGAARAMTQLDRVQEAHTTLTDLATTSPDDAEVQLWLGRVEEQLGHADLAETHYRESVRIAPAVFEPYLSLARLYDHAGRTSDAVALLESAASAVPQTAQVREELGTYALSQGRLSEAEAAFRAALALDDALPAARFGLAVTLRRENHLDEAAQAFEALAAVDPNHPGLALERGLLFEARHEENRAVEFYRQALLEHPDDSSLELRLGGALVAVGNYDEAETTLAPVMQEVPPHAEAEYYTGRIAFARGTFPEAEQHFNRALGLDSTRGEFYMWAGWAALMANQIGLAVSRSDEALQHDASLGDAYYVRGVARLRSGMVRDALVDLRRAVELSPDRHEALAAEGDCFDQLRQLPDAITAYSHAVAADDLNGLWWYRLGRLQLDASHTSESVHALSRATQIGETMTPRPAWLADAHRILGDGMRLSGERAGAIQHYQRYLAIAPDSLDRDDVRSALFDLGVVPSAP